MIYNLILLFANDVSNEVNVDVEKGGKKGGSVEEAIVKKVAVKKGVVKEAAVKEGAVKKGSVKEATVKKGAVKEVVVKKGAVKEVAVKKGAVKKEVSEGGSIERNKKKRKLSVKAKKLVKDDRLPTKKNPAKDYRCPEKKLAKASNNSLVEKKPKKDYRRPAEKKRKMVKDNICLAEKEPIKDDRCSAEKKRRVVDNAIKIENRNRPDSDSEEDEVVASILERDDSDSDVEMYVLFSEVIVIISKVMDYALKVMDNALKVMDIVLDRFFSTHCRPHTLVDLMKDFSDEQVKSVVEIGFGGLLDLKLTITVTTLLPWLVDHFDPVSWMFSISPGKGFVISPYDVYDVFELPLNNGMDVVESTGSIDLQLKQEWRSMFDVAGSAGIPLHKLEARIVQLIKDGGELFKRLFVMIAFTTFLAPVANRTAYLSFVKALENVDEIKNFNCCKYVHERLCRAILKYKKRKRIIKFDVLDSMTSDEEIHSIATDAIHEQFLLMKRNMEVVTNYHLKKVESLKKHDVACASSSSSPVLQSQDYNPRMFEIVDIVLSVKKLPGVISNIACDVNVGGGENGGRVENVPEGDFVNNIV
uniref:Uncharacterized protein n=1 Tax=Chenopodium quinoa TaxID=63459 RepID=A0A803LJN5_CHEQI